MMRIIGEFLITISSSFALSLAVKVTIVMAFVLSIYRLTRRSRASIRHLVLVAGFIILPAVPVAMVIAPSVQIQVPVAPIVTLPIIVSSEHQSRPAISNRAVPGPNTAGRPAWLSLSISSVVAVVWAAGAALFLLPMVAGVWQLGRIRRSGLPWAHGRTVLQELVYETHTKIRVAVLSHGSIPGPITCGIFRPVIVFPSVADSWSEADLRRAMVHELEHVRRHDCLMHGMARWICAFYWFHPLVWVCWSRLGLEAERACDDVALSGGDAVEYADQLVTLAKAITAGAKPLPLAMANRTDLATRVAAVLDSSQRRGRAGALRVVAAIVLGFLPAALISPLRVVGAIAPATAQSSETRQEFEVASIKSRGPFKPGMTGVQFLPGGFMRAENAGVALLTMAAYRLSPKQLDFKNLQNQSGFKDLMNEVFDIEAKAGVNDLPESAPLEARRHRHALMLQTLLADRFKLVLHKETREMPMYALVVAPGGPRLKPSPAGQTCPTETRCGTLGGGPASGIKGVNVPISELVSDLTFFGDREVIDRTGIEGHFDIELPSWSRPWVPAQPDNDRERPEDPNDPPIFTVLQNTLGLRLESIRGPLDVYVIDHVERPTPN
jgi:uncharacterized protein (TIGR03435 family)